MGDSGGIVITGASTGIGRACALALTQRGYEVFAGVRSDEAAAALTREAPGLRPIRLDVTDTQSIEGAARAVERELASSRLVGLFNNAGIVVAAPLEFVALDELRRQLETNVIGPVAVTQAFVPLLRRSLGRVIISGSVAGILSTPFLGPYSMSKYAVEAMTDALRFELAPWGIRVALLEPGPIATPIWEKGRKASDALLTSQPPEVQELYGRRIETIQYLSSRAAREADPVEKVVSAVLHALESPRPRHRYLIGRIARQQQLVSFLPSRMQDWLFQRMFDRLERRLAARRSARSEAEN